MTGMPIRNTQRRYTTTNAPPPFEPARYGNFQTLPSPTADPVTARMKAMRDDQCPCREVRLAPPPGWVTMDSGPCPFDEAAIFIQLLESDNHD